MSDNQLVAAPDPVFQDVKRVRVLNRGFVRQPLGYEYDVNLDAEGTTPNAVLGDVEIAVTKAVLPLSASVADFLVIPVAEYEFAGHLGLAAHDTKVDDHLMGGVDKFIAGLPFTPRASFIARR